ncbi:MAG: Ig-like domain-containing protein [Acidimicrobiia bacterium]
MTWQGERWKDRPFRAWLIRVAVFVVPIFAGIAAATITAQLLPSADGIWQTIAWWTLVLGSSFVVMWFIDRMARKLLPMAALLRMSLVFPNKAPSRFGVTLKSYSSKRIQADVERAHAEGVDDDPTRAAEYVLALIASMGHHDRLTRGHAERTRAYTDLVAEELGLSQADQDRLRWGALLHDIGKLGVPAEILNSDHGLSEEDWEAVKHHPRDGYELTKPIHAFLGTWALTILHHHERYDGTGYPLGLSGENIAYGARIVAVGDAYDAMTAFRTYQAPLSPATARAELAAGAGTQFDPAVVRAFLALSLRPLRRVAGPLVVLGQLPFVTGLQRLGDVATAVMATAATLAVVVVSGVVPGPGTPGDDAPVAQPVEVVAAAPGASSADPAGASQTSSNNPSETTTTTTIAPTTTTTLAPPPTVPPAPPPRRSGTAPPPPPPTPPPAPPPATTTTTLPPWLPTAVDDAASTDEDARVALDVLANDSDNDGDLDPTTLAIATPPLSGTATVATPAITYTPDPDTNGTDTFAYEICDLGGRCSTATVTVTVASVNDAPAAFDDTETTNEDTAATIDVLANDTDIDDGLDPTSLTVTGTPALGTATVVGTSISYQPAANVSGSDSVDYQVCDVAGACSTATITVEIVPVNDAPDAVDDAVDGDPRTDVILDVLANDADIDGDPLTISAYDAVSSLGGSVVCGAECTYTPPDPWTGADSFTYTIDDGAGGADTATVTITPTSLDLQLFLRAGGVGDQTSTPVLPFSPDAGPTNNALPNYDADRDAGPGLLLLQIEHGPGQQIAETDSTKYQLWLFPVASDLVLAGSASMDIWAATADLETGLEARLRTYVLDCPATSVDGTDCTEIADRRFDDRDPWSPADDQWERALWDYGPIDYTIPAGRSLGVKLTIAGVHTDDDMRFGFDAAGFESSFTVRVP